MMRMCLPSGSPVPRGGAFDDHASPASPRVKLPPLIALLILLVAAPVAGAAPRVVLLDTGVALGHPELAGRIALDEALVLVEDGRGIRDCHGHGTAVASIIAGARIGLAPAATLTPIRILDCAKRTTPERVLRALRHVLAQRQSGAWPEPTIVNASFALPRDARIDALVDRLAGAGIPVIASAGNDGISACGFSPARARTSIAVGAYETRRRPYWSSNTGPCVDVYAPAHRFGATIPAGYKRRSGTSVSAAIATGVVARANPARLTPGRVLRILHEHSVREAWGYRLSPRRPAAAP